MQRLNRFSLRTMLVLLSLCAIGFAIYAREVRMNTPEIVPVQFHTEPNYEEDIPEAVYTYRHPRKARRIRWRPQFTPHGRRKIAEELVASPSDFGSYKRGGPEVDAEIAREHSALFLAKMPTWLSPQSSERDLLSGGTIALALQDELAIEQATKEVLRRLKTNPNNTRLSNFPSHVQYCLSRLSEVDKTGAISKLCERSQENRYLDPTITDGDHAEYLVDCLPGNTRDSYRDAKLIFSALAKIWDHARAYDALTKQFSKNPHTLLPVLADATGEEEIPMLLAAMDRENAEQTQRLPADLVARLLVDRQLGVNDPQVLDRLERAFHENPPGGYYQGKQLINNMVRLGFQRRAELVKTLPAIHAYSEFPTPWTHWLIHDITYHDYAAYLDQLKIGPPVDVELILRELKVDVNCVAGYEPDLFVRRALIQIGVAADVAWDEFNNYDLDKMIHRISSTSQGEFAPTGAEVDPTDKQTVRIGWNKMFFEVHFVDTGDWYDPHAVVDVLNAIVDKYVDSDKRFVAYAKDDDARVRTIAYLDEQVIRHLSDRFGLVPYPRVRVVDDTKTP